MNQPQSRFDPERELEDLLNWLSSCSFGASYDKCQRIAVLARAKARELDKFYKAWPGGLSEIEASIEGHKRIIAELTPASENRASDDTRRLDFLEQELDDSPLLLFHEKPKNGNQGFRGLGLRCTDRTLREALDSLMSATTAWRKEGQ